MNSIIKEDDIIKFVKNNFNCTEVTGLDRLTGGLLNVVYRVFSDRGSVIYKHAPPFIATNPEIKLDPSRIRIEAECLKIIPDLLIDYFASHSLSIPELLAYDDANKQMIMEDIKDSVDLEANLKTHGDNVGKGGYELGNFISLLHKKSLNKTKISQDINNVHIRKTRNELQYMNIAVLSKHFCLEDHDKIGRICSELGRKFSKPGKCLIMGDLWPRSVLCSNGKLTVIDWEMADFAFPGQDIGHLFAHLWMNKQFAVSIEHQENIERFIKNFILGYLNNSILEETDILDAITHFGAEIFARTLGAFKDSYFYKGMDTDSNKLVTAVKTASNHIINPKETELFDRLSICINSCF